MPPLFRGVPRAFVLLFGIILFLPAARLSGQGLTTSSLSGVVRDTSGHPVGDALVTIVHESTGTVSTAVTQGSGRYYLSGLRIDGNYTVSVAKTGLASSRNRNIVLDLVAGGTLDFVLGETVVLEGVRVTADRGIFDAAKSGPNAMYTESDVGSLPTIERDLVEILAYHPQITLEDGQLTAQGQNYRSNALLVDGVNSSDRHGITGAFGTFRSPVSLDAIQAISVELSPFDVRYKDFTGALVKVLTKSGTNTVRGSTLVEYTSSDLRGKNPLTQRKDNFDEITYGFTLGGPIIRNKLFFFLAYEDFKREAAPPTPNFTPDPAALATIVARARTFGYEPGDTAAAQDVQYQKSYKAKVDWTINRGHRLSLSYQYVDGANTAFPNYSTEATTSTSTSFSGRWSDGHRENKTYAAQLFSTWSQRFQTEVTVSRNTWRRFSIGRGADFPDVNIKAVPGISTLTGLPLIGSIYMGTSGSSPFSKSAVETTNVEAFGTYTLGNHVISGGLTLDSSTFAEGSIPAYFGIYIFNTIPAWVSGGPIASYSQQLVAPGRALEDSWADFSWTTYGAFLQDTWRPTNELTLTLGGRVDLPHTSKKPKVLPGFTEAFGFANDTMITEEPYFSPRFGFNYQFNAKRKTQLRGGLGVFIGKSPSLWFSDGYKSGSSVSVATTNPVMAFQPDPYKQVIPAGVTPAPTVTVIDGDFKMPMLAKSSIAIDRELPFLGLTGTLEFTYSKVLNGPRFAMLNLQQNSPYGSTLPDGRLLFGAATDAAGGGDDRAPISPGVTGQPGTSSVGKRRVRTFADVTGMYNSAEGDSTYATIQFSRRPRDHWGATVAYTYGDATETSPASTNAVSIGGRPYTNPNENIASTSTFNIRHRVVGQVSLNYNLIRKLRTSISFNYEGRSGRPYSYTFNGDANGDGFEDTDLLYVPTGPTDPKVRFNNSAEQAAFFAFVESSNLKNYKGRIVPRNTEEGEWYTRFDVRISQDLPVFRRFKSQVYMNIVNLGNLIDDQKGLLSTYGAGRITVAGTGYDPAANAGKGQYVYFYNNQTMGQRSLNTNVSRYQVKFGARAEF